MSRWEPLADSVIEVLKRLDFPNSLTEVLKLLAPFPFFCGVIVSTDHKWSVEMSVLLS